MDHLLGIEDLTSQFILSIIDEFQYVNTSEKSKLLFYKENSQHFRSKIMSTLFLSESLRTRAGFISSFLRLGGSHLSFEEHERAIKKLKNTETIEDISGFISQYCDVLTVRTNCEETFSKIVTNSNVPVISAGHAEIEHPTTAINYLAEIFCTLGHLDNLKVLVIAKLPNRCINSLIFGLKKWSNNEIVTFDPFIVSALDNENTILIKYNDYKVKLSTSYLKKFDLIFFDEPDRDYIYDTRLKSCFSLSDYESIKEFTHIIHAKPVLNFFDHNLKLHLKESLQKQSKNSALLKSILYKKLIHI